MLAFANHLHQETWWRHPVLRNEHEGGWKGCALCYSKARDVIRKTQRHTFEQFKDADYFVLMFSDGGGACYCDACSRDQAALFLRMVDDTRQTIRDVGSKAEVVFWNWALDWWYSEFTKGIPGYLTAKVACRAMRVVSLDSPGGCSGGRAAGRVAFCRRDLSDSRSPHRPGFKLGQDRREQRLPLVQGR